LAAELRWHQRYVESERNATDYDSRVGNRGELRAGEVVSAAPSGIDRLLLSCASPCATKSAEEPSAAVHHEAVSNAPTSQEVVSSARDVRLLHHIASPSQPRGHRQPQLAPRSSQQRPLQQQRQPAGHRPLPRCHGAATPGTRTSSATASPATRPGRGAQGKAPAGRFHRQHRRLHLVTGSVQPSAFLELFAGRGRLTGAVFSSGLRVCPHFEIKNGVRYDLCNRAVQKVILRWIQLGKIWWDHLGTPCTFCSTARTTGKSVHTERLARMAVLFSLEVLKACTARGVFWTIENPLSSKLWQQVGFQQYLSCADSAIFDCCEYGCHFYKPTRVSGTLPGIQLLSRRCRGGHVHEVLQGTVRVLNPLTQKLETMWRTSLAGAYSPPLVRAWARLAARAAPRGARRGSDDAARLGRSCWQADLSTVSPGIFDELSPPRVPPGCPREWPADAPQWGGSHRFVPKKGDGSRAEAASSAGETVSRRTRRQARHLPEAVLSLSQNPSDVPRVL